MKNLYLLILFYIPLVFADYFDNGSSPFGYGSDACSTLGDCFNCTVASSCSWDGEKCNSGPQKNISQFFIESPKCGDPL